MTPCTCPNCGTEFTPAAAAQSPKSFALTARQREVLNFIKNRYANGEQSPSYDEIRDSLGFASKSQVFRVVAALVERGVVAKMQNRARSIVVVEAPQ